MFEFFKPKQDVRRARILVIDDEQHIVETLRDRLEMSNYDVIPAFNGKEGLAKALAQKPDLILLDIVMPVMDGLEMLELLRKDEVGREIPVIMLSARTQTQDIDRAKNCRIEDFILKPFDLCDLLEIIESIITNKKSAIVQETSL
ncbi:MAG: hypothetical protein A2Y07_06815 [Planctomycetes bacterium GWF2_50_10]|nr:MAG: hypothetical protein A2Y07_06815 [Planctomycetes bacterium GWF2_50_10]